MRMLWKTCKEDGLLGKSILTFLKKRMRYNDDSSLYRILFIVVFYCIHSFSVLNYLRKDNYQIMEIFTSGVDKI